MRGVNSSGSSGGRDGCDERYDDYYDHPTHTYDQYGGQDDRGHEEVPIYKITVTEIEREEDVVQVEDVVIVTIKTGDIMTMTRIDTGIMTLKTMDIRVSRSRSRSSHTVIHEEAKENH